MEQQIRFCTTSEGVSIAYATLGEGPPLVYVNGWPGHLALEWEKPVAREFLEELAAGVTLIRYDMRGSGLSDREVPELSLDAWVNDLQAVVERLQLDRFTLLSLGLLAGPIAITYAASHPEQVAKLILSNAYLRGSDLTTPERGRALAEYIANFGIFATIGPDTDLSELEKSQDALQIAREAAPVAVQGTVARAMLAADVSGLADRLSMPTLVMHGRHDQTVPFALGRALAAQLPNARFVPFETSWGAAPWRQQQALIEEVRRFLGVETVGRPRPPDGEMATILFADIADSTALTEELGDAAFRARSRGLDAALRAMIRDGGGTPVEGKLLGDGVMAVFTSGRQAIECAVHCRAAGGDAGLPLHLGIHAGDVIREGGNVYGGAVNIAARIAAAAAAGEILVSDIVRGLARTSAGVDFEDRGEQALKGIEEPQRLFVVRWRE